MKDLVAVMAFGAATSKALHHMYYVYIMFIFVSFYFLFVQSSFSIRSTEAYSWETGLYIHL